MKLAMLLSIPFIIFASSETLFTGESLSNREHMSLHTYNHRPSVKLKNKRKIYRLAKVDKAQAATVAKKETSEDVTSLRLRHQGKYLIYKITTEGHSLIINALDGTVIKKQKHLSL